MTIIGALSDFRETVTFSVGAALLLLSWSTWPFVLTAHHVLRCHRGLYAAAPLVILFANSPSSPALYFVLIISLLSCPRVCCLVSVRYALFWSSDHLAAGCVIWPCLILLMPLWMEYAIQFKTLAASCDWNEGALRTMFLEGLNFEIQDEIAIHELPQDLEGFINLATRVEVCLRLRQRRLAPRSSWGLEETQPFKAHPPPQSCLPDPEPVQLGRLRLSARKRQQRLVQGLCLYCGKPDHFALSCPLKAKAH